MAANRTSNYIATIPMKSEEQVMEVKKVLEQIFGWVTLRGRHSDRKKVLGRSWSKSRQNDIPWRQSEYIDIYLHSANPNRIRIWKKQGMERKNLQLNNTNVMVARMIGNMGMGLSDVVKHQKETMQKDALLAVHSIWNIVKTKDPKFKRREMKRKYQNKSYKLQPGDWGYIAQALLDFTEKYGRVTFSELKEYYDVILRGNSHMIKGGSFTHHLQSLVKLSNGKVW
jgi:hypothetical protein